MGERGKAKGLRNGKVKFETGDDGVSDSPSSSTDYFFPEKKKAKESEIY